MTIRVERKIFIVVEHEGIEGTLYLDRFIASQDKTNMFIIPIMNQIECKLDFEAKVIWDEFLRRVCANRVQV